MYVYDVYNIESTRYIIYRLVVITDNSVSETKELKSVQVAYLGLFEGKYGNKVFETQFF